MKLVCIAGDTFYVPGMTNVVVHKDYLIDPGKNDKVDWHRPENTFGRKIAYALITHCHDDHFWHAADMRASGALHLRSGHRTAADRRPGHPHEGLLHVGQATRGDETLVFPGHALPGRRRGGRAGHAARDRPDAGPHERTRRVPDAVVAKDIWETAGVFYFTDIPDTRRTLKSLLDTDADWVLSTHTQLLTKEEAVELADVNLKGLDWPEALIIDAVGKDGSSTETIVSKLCQALNMKEEFSAHLVGETATRAFLHALYESNVIDYELKGHKVLWHPR
jgi:hypothetical protein